MMNDLVKSNEINIPDPINTYYFIFVFQKHRLSSFFQVFYLIFCNESHITEKIHYF